MNMEQAQTNLTFQDQRDFWLIFRALTDNYICPIKEKQDKKLQKISLCSSHVQALSCDSPSAR